MGTGGWEAAQARELRARTAFHPPQGWSQTEVETACSSISEFEEPQEKMEPAKMAPLKNAPRDALVSARGERDRAHSVALGPVRRASPSAWWGRQVGGLARRLEPGDVAGKGQWGPPVPGAPSVFLGSPSKGLPRGFVSLARGHPHPQVRILLASRGALTATWVLMLVASLTDRSENDSQLDPPLPLPGKPVKAILVPLLPPLLKVFSKSICLILCDH